MTRFRSLWFVAFLVLPCLLVSCSSGPKTVDGIWDEYVNAFEQYQRALRDFGVKRWPEYKSSFETQKDYQLARIELRDRQFRFLRENYPDRLPTNHTVHDLIHFKWHDRWDTEFYRADPSGQSLAKRVNKRKQQFEEQGQWPVIRERLQQLGPDSRYHEINRRYQNRLSELDDRLQVVTERNS